MLSAGTVSVECGKNKISLVNSHMRETIESTLFLQIPKKYFHILSHLELHMLVGVFVWGRMDSNTTLRSEYRVQYKTTHIMSIPMATFSNKVENLQKT